MKYDVLEKVKEDLHKSMNPNTARKYYSSLVKLLDPIQFANPAEISREYLEEEIVKLFQTKNEYSAAKNALKHFKRCYPQLDIPSEAYFAECSANKRNRSKKPKKILSLSDTVNAIKRIDNEKLRLAYRLALLSGLRVSELSAVKKSDLLFDERNELCVEVTKGKGGANGIVNCIKDEVFYTELKAFIEKKEGEEPLFFSEAYMRKEALKSGFECHDLRRIFSQIRRKELMEEMSVYEANKEVQNSLRHARFSTTKRYLFNRKLVFDMDEK